MDDIAVEDEKKPFDSVVGGHDEDTQPDPDEQIMTESGNGRVWMVKIPRHLMERWSAVDAEGVPLATIRVYDNPTPGAPQRIIVQTPSDPLDPASPMDQYEMDMLNQDVNNQIVVAEREKEPHSRARTTIMTGKVKHECNMRPRLSANYRRMIKARTQAANTSTRPIKRIEDALPGGRGGIIKLSSGVAPAAGFSEHIRPKIKPAKGQYERMARMPRNQLLDLLFGLYREREQWPLKVLREKTQQPEVYLKEVLSEIAFLHRSGEFNGSWELKGSFKGDGVKGEGGSITELYKREPPPDMDMPMADEDEDEDDDDEDDDDMEEVS